MTGIIDFRTSLTDSSGSPITSLNPLPVTGGGGGGGGGTLSDTVFTDSTGQLFVYRDTGTGVPSAFSIPSWNSYSPVSPVSFPGGGGGGGSSLSDTIFKDKTGQVFVYRDTGLGTPSAFAIPSWTTYTVQAPVSAIGDSERTEQLLTQMFNLQQSPMGFDRSLGRQRVTGVIESGTITTVSTVSTVTTVTTVTTLSSMTDFNAGGLQGRHLVYGANQSAWADVHRARIT